MLDKEQRVLMKDSTVLNEKPIPSRSLCFQLRCGEWNGEETRSEAYVFLRIGSHGGNDCRSSPHVHDGRISIYGEARPSCPDLQYRRVYNLESFPTERIKDGSLRSALERGLIQPINQAMEKKGYRVEILGSVSDGRKSFVLFNVLNHSDKDIIVRDFTLDYGGYETPSVGAMIANMSGSGQIPQGRTHIMRIPRIFCQRILIRIKQAFILPYPIRRIEP